MIHKTIANNPAEKHVYNRRHMMTEYMRLECSFIYRLNFRNHANIKRLLSTRAYYPERRSFFFEGKRQLRNCQNTAQRIRFNRAQCFVEHLLDYPHVSRKPLEMCEEYSANNIRTTRRWCTLKIGSAVKQWRFSTCLQRGLQVSTLASC